MFRCLSKILIAVMLVGGAWQIGSAGKIYIKAWFAQQLLEQAWQRTLAGERHVRPWPWADTWPVVELVVPRLGIRQIVLSGDSGRVLAFAPGHSEASAKPGALGMTVISGHRDTSFSFLKDIQDGDLIELHVPTGAFSYTVSERAVVDQRYFSLDPHINAQSEALHGNQAYEASLMLVTCYPFNALQAGGDERFLVLARR